MAAGCGVTIKTLRKWMADEEAHRPTEEEETELMKKGAEIERMRREVSHYKSINIKLAKSLSAHEIIGTAITEASKIVPPITVKTSKSAYKLNELSDTGSETDILQLGDLHGGEVVSSVATHGISEYDMKIMARRLSVVFAKTLEIIYMRRSALNIPNLIVSLGGDMVSGEIHEELIRTNVEHTLITAIRTASMLAQGLAYLSPHFENIDVPCVPGNHGRVHQKRYYKDYFVSYDTLVYQWLAILCKGLPNVKFHIPKSPFCLIDAENTRLLILHGEMIKSWSGIPHYGIERFYTRMKEMLSGYGERFDIILLHHFHNDNMISKSSGRIIMNGCLKGGDEYSIGEIQAANEPSQNLIYIHNKNGYLGVGPIYAKAGSNLDLEITDFLPDVWADSLDNLEETFSVFGRQMRT